MNKTICPHTAPLHHSVNIPGDKSISHRSIMFGALSEGVTKITNFLNADDCHSTIACFRQMGIQIEENPNHILVFGQGLHGLKCPKQILYTGNSGTTTRLISGILSGQNFDSSLTGDSSIEKRPMKRVIEPLSLMGAKIESVRENNCAPLAIHSSSLHGIEYVMPVASAQVKSAILLAGLYANSPTTVIENEPSRNHTELMLQHFGCNIKTTASNSLSGNTIIITPGNELHGCDILVPSDISSAAYFIAAAILIPGSEVLLKNIGINPTRDGIIKVLINMGAKLEVLNQRNESGEEVADLLIYSSQLHSVTLEGSIIPTLIDEIPLIAILASYSEGTTIIKDAAELHYKECDRIEAMVTNLNAIGGSAIATKDGMIIEGKSALKGGSINSYHDHRIAMSFAIAALASKEGIEIKDSECITISYPEFFDSLEQILTK